MSALVWLGRHALPVAGVCWVAIFVAWVAVFIARLMGITWIPLEYVIPLFTWVGIALVVLIVSAVISVKGGID